MINTELLFLSGFLIKNGMAFWPYKRVNVNIDNCDLKITTSNGIVNGTYTTTEPTYFIDAMLRPSGYWRGYRLPWGEQVTWDGTDKWPDFLLPAGTQFIVERSNYGFINIYLDRPRWIEMPELTTGG